VLSIPSALIQQWKIFVPVKAIEHRVASASQAYAMDIMIMKQDNTQSTIMAFVTEGIVHIDIHPFGLGRWKAKKVKQIATTRREVLTI